jgi:16S rRNA (cytosine1402-N4)-methyltransferase
MRSSKEWNVITPILPFGFNILTASTKQTFKELSTACICPPELPVCVCHHKAVLKAKNKAIEPSAGEVEMNPRSRSAKLRVGIKL